MPQSATRRLGLLLAVPALGAGCASETASAPPPPPPTSLTVILPLSRAR